MPSTEFVVDRLRVHVFPDRATTGRAAAEATGADMRELARSQGPLSMVFAAAPSQIEFLHALAGLQDPTWPRTSVFHLDEYAGLPPTAPQSFVHFLCHHLFDRIHVKESHYLDGTAASLGQECRRYEALLERHPLDIACTGIGENGHIAFNEPGTADVSDPGWIRTIELDDASRQQQVNDACFERLEEVPTRAITMTVPAIMAASRIDCVVPGAPKAAAVKRTLEGPVDPDCPASVLRTHPDATLYVDVEAAALLGWVAL